MLRLRLLTGIFALALPASVMAMDTTVWDFTNGTGGQWDIAGFQAPEETPDGLHLVAPGDGDGRMLRLTELSHPIDAIRMVFARSSGGKGFLLWHRRNDPPTELIQLPFVLSGNAPEEYAAELSGFPQWDPQTDVIGFVLDPGADVVLERIELEHTTFPEKIWNAFLAFWTFDTFRSYSINFLWGPLLSFTPIGLEQLYDKMPPFGWSVNRVLYAILGLTILWLSVRWLQRGRRDGMRDVRTYLCVLLVLWLVFDVRMGLETMSYAWSDLTQYAWQPPGKKVLRNYQNFYDAVEQSLPDLQEFPRFMFLAPPQTPFIGITRYLAYPSTPLFPEEDTSQAKVWLVFRRYDVTVNDAGELTIGGTAVSPPGHIVKRFDDYSFLFRIK